MDLNLVVLAGRIAVEPEVRIFPTGVALVRYLVTVRTTEPRRRVDVIPVSLWDPDDDQLGAPDMRGRDVWVAGSVQRRFWSRDDARTSRIEVVAHDLKIRDEHDATTWEAHVDA